MIELKLAWRNVLRNTRRTLLTALVLAVGLAAMIFIDGLVAGMKVDMVRSATQTLMGEGQIHAQGYRDEPEVDLVIPALSEVESRLAQTAGIEAWSTRALAQGMLSSASGMAAVQIYGVDAEKESKISLFARAITEGQYLGSKPPLNEQEILIGKKLARDLDVQLGDRIVLTAAQSSQKGSGELAQELFRVSGIFDLGSKGLNSTLAVVHRPALARVLQIGGGAHQIALRFRDPNRPPPPDRTLAPAGGIPPLDGADARPESHARNERHLALCDGADSLWGDLDWRGQLPADGALRAHVRVWRTEGDRHPPLEDCSLDLP